MLLEGAERLGDRLAVLPVSARFIPVAPQGR
jgi:hypothetical protein